MVKIYFLIVIKKHSSSNESVQKNSRFIKSQATIGAINIIPGTIPRAAGSIPIPL